MPAKLIRMRFADSEVKYLMKLKWWNMETEKLEKNIDMFEDIKRLVNSDI